MPKVYEAQVTRTAAAAIAIALCELDFSHGWLIIFRELEILLYLKFRLNRS